MELAGEYRFDRRPTRLQTRCYYLCYDGDATSGITDLTNVSKVSVSTLGNGIFQVNGADTDVTVYNLSGNVVKVVPANEVIDLSSAAKGVYIMTVGGQAFKVIK